MIQPKAADIVCAVRNLQGELMQIDGVWVGATTVSETCALRVLCVGCTDGTETITVR
jgi:hypothetical protein